MNDLSKPSRCPRCFGLFDVEKKVWNDNGTIYHLTCWINKTKEDDELHGKDSAYDDELHGKDSYCEKMRG